MKRCHICGGSFDESHFYKNSSKADGLTASCKVCHRAWRKDYYHRNKDRVLSSNRRWDKAHADKCRAMARGHSMANYNNPSSKPMFAAYVAVRNALKSGDIKREECTVCGDPTTEAHHEDYSKPLDVVWLCRKHHKEVHMLTGSRRGSAAALDGTTRPQQGIDGAKPENKETK